DGPGHLAVAVLGEPSRVNRINRFFPTGEYGRHAGAYWADATCNFPSPEISVRYPTSTPVTSVMAFRGPGVPSNGTPRSRARCTDSAALCSATAKMMHMTGRVLLFTSVKPPRWNPATVLPGAEVPNSSPVRLPEFSPARRRASSRRLLQLQRVLAVRDARKWTACHRSCA